MPPKQPAFPSLGEMLYDHFIEEVRQRDHDGDGRLSRREYGGNADEFSVLDQDRDGLINAADLARVALDRNPTLKDLITGEYSPVYNSLLRWENPSDDELATAVREGAAKVAEHRRADRAKSEASGPAKAWDQDAPASGAETILLDFLKRHPDLRTLHARLQDLADRLGRNRRYAPIDRLA